MGDPTAAEGNDMVSPKRSATGRGSCKNRLSYIFLEYLVQHVKKVLRFYSRGGYNDNDFVKKITKLKRIFKEEKEVVSLKRLKQKVAAGLIVIMSMSATLSAMADTAVAEVGNKWKPGNEIRVRFDPNGGRWDKVMATNANAVLASWSNGKWEAPEISYSTGTPSETTKAPTGILSRKFRLRDWSIDAAWEFADDDDCFYITLGKAGIWYEDKDWEYITHDDENLEFGGWYYGDQLVDDDTMIYGGTKEEIDKGILLTAKWVEKDKEPVTEVVENNYFSAEDVGEVEGLKEGQKLVISPIEGEYANWEEEPQAMWSTLQATLTKLGTNFRLEGNGTAGSDFIGIDIDVTNYTPGEDGAIHINLVAPSDFITSEDEKVYAIHYKSDGTEEVLNVAITKLVDERFNMKFTVKNGFSPFFFVKVRSTQSGGNTNPGSSGGNTGGGGGGGGSSSATKDYTMHGTWIVNGTGWKFLKDSGEYAVNTWGYINGQWYYFDAEGNMVTGWYVVNGQWYYMNPAAGALQGAMMTGWIQDPAYNAWFYLNASGAMMTGWQQINGVWYYLNPVSDGTRGAMAVNTSIDGYYVNADGAWVQ